MKRLTLLFAILTIFAAPAFADDEAVSDLLVFTSDLRNADGDAAQLTDCLTGYFLENLVLVFTPPANTPDSYLVRWTARKNRTWRATDKPNTAHAGNLTLSHANADAIADSIILPAGASLKVPAGQSILVQIRPFYGERKGSKSRATINSADWIDDQYGDQEAACA